MSAVFRFGAAFDEVVEADLCESIEPQVEAELAQHPIEDGSQLTDHVTRRPRSISLELLFSPEPEGRPNAEPTGAARPDLARWRLLRAATAGEICRLQVDDEVYYPAVITRVSAPREFKDGTSRRLRVDVQEMLVAESQSVRVPKRRMAKGVRHKAKTEDKGAVPPLVLTPYQADVIGGVVRTDLETIAGLVAP